MIRAERAREIDDAVRAWQERGGSVVFVTLTMRHRRSDALRTTLDAALKGWRGILQGAPWQRTRERHGIAGYVRAVEVTYGDSGWHPHIHALLFTESRWDSSELALFEGWLYERWADRVTRAGGGLPTRLRGVDVRQADEHGRVVGQYLAKVQDGTGDRVRIGQEIARFDFKNGRGGSVMPFELLDADAGDVRARGLWGEYVTATHGRRALTWSKGLRAELLPEPERSDSDIVEDTEAVSPVLFTVEAETWRNVRRDPSLVCAVLEAVEWGEAVAAERLARGRYRPWEDGNWVDVGTGEVVTPRVVRAA